MAEEAAQRNGEKGLRIDVRTISGAREISRRCYAETTEKIKVENPDKAAESEGAQAKTGGEIKGPLAPEVSGAAFSAVRARPG